MEENFSSNDFNHPLVSNGLADYVICVHFSDFKQTLICFSNRKKTEMKVNSLQVLLQITYNFPVVKNENNIKSVTSGSHCYSEAY
jgi:hypothetical protein